MEFYFPLSTTENLTGREEGRHFNTRHSSCADCFIDGPFRHGFSEIGRKSKNGGESEEQDLTGSRIYMCLALTSPGSRTIYGVG